MTESAPTYKAKDDPRAVAWLKRHEQLKGERAVFESTWQEIADYFLPRKAGILTAMDAPDIGKEARLFDTTGQDAAIQAAAGLLSWTSPANEPWHNFEPVRQLRRSDATKQWLQECSELSREYLGNSNFYTERHEDLLNHVTFCTSAIFVSRIGNKTVFKSLAIGTYVIAENFLGQVDTLYREFNMSARQIQQQFGADKMGRETPLPECVARVLAGENQQPDKEFTIVHVVEPRPAKDRIDGAGNGPVPGWRKAFVDIYILKDEKSVLAEDGFDSFPYMVGRWLKAKYGPSECVWGYGPGFTALPEARQLNFMRKMIDVHAEKSAFPPYMIPDTLEGELNISARGVTYYAQGIESTNIIPLPVTGDLKTGMDVAEYRRQAILTKFHVDFFQMFRHTDPRITATQAVEMAGERLTMISPAFSRLTSEKDTPMLTRCFELWAEGGMLPEPPEEAIQQVGDGYMTPNPEVVYTSRLALAAKQLQNVSLDRSLNRIMAIAKLDPSIMLHLNKREMVRDSMRNDGVPARWITPWEEVQAAMEAEAEARQMAQQMEMMKAAGSGAKSLADAASTEAGKQLLGA